MDYVPIYAGAEGGGADGTVRISPVVMQNMNVRTAGVARGDLERHVETVGFVDYDEAGLTHVHLRTEGWIEELMVRTTGARVEQGQPLFRLYSPMLVNAQEELLQVVRRGGSVEPARERLRALGLGNDEIRAIERAGEPRRVITVRARRGGVVQKLNVAEGMYVMPGTEVMTIADLSRVWIVADLFEHQVDSVAAGRAASVTLPFRRGEVLEGKVDYVYPELAGATRTVRARLVFDNPGERLKPGMYADVRLQADSLSNVLHVPAEAVIRTGRQDRVIVAVGEGRFQARPVALGRRAGDRLEIASGLREGERVVTSGQFLIDSEASVTAELNRMDDAEPEADEEVWADGRINEVDAAGRQVNLYHEPIPQIGWPAMTMDFAVADDVSLEGIQPAMAVRFRMREREEFVFEITAIQPASHDEHDH
jgi:membrane fusion protein, copper/silver efflux system